MTQQAPAPLKSEIRKRLDKASDSRAAIEAAQFFDKEKAINKFMMDLERFLDLLVEKIDTLEGAK